MLYHIVLYYIILYYIILYYIILYYIIHHYKIQFQCIKEVLHGLMLYAMEKNGGT